MCDDCMWHLLAMSVCHSQASGSKFFFRGVVARSSEVCALMPGCSSLLWSLGRSKLHCFILADNPPGEKTLNRLNGCYKPCHEDSTRLAKNFPAPAFAEMPPQSIHCQMAKLHRCMNAERVVCKQKFETCSCLKLLCSTGVIGAS